MVLLVRVMSHFVAYLYFAIPKGVEIVVGGSRHCHHCCRRRRHHHHRRRCRHRRCHCCHLASAMARTIVTHLLNIVCVYHTRKHVVYTRIHIQLRNMRYLAHYLHDMVWFDMVWHILLVTDLK